MKIEGFHNRTGQWVTLLEAEKADWQAKSFVNDFAIGGNSHATLEGTTVNRTHFSAFRIVDFTLIATKDDDTIPF